jgi:hypothetical protein
LRTANTTCAPDFAKCLQWTTIPNLSLSCVIIQNPKPWTRKQQRDYHLPWTTPCEHHMCTWFCQTSARLNNSHFISVVCRNPKP